MIKAKDLDEFPQIEKISKEKILDELSKRNDLKKITKKIAKQDQYLGDELYSELFLSLLKISEGELIRLYQSKEIGFYIIRILSNTFNSNSSTFFYRIKQGNRKIFSIEDCCDIEDETDNTKEKYLSALEISMNKLSWYDRRILEMYMQLKTIKAVSEQINIAETYISRSLKSSKRQLKELIEKHIEEND